eukprot:UN22753
MEIVLSEGTLTKTFGIFRCLIWNCLCKLIKNLNKLFHIQ